MAKSLDYKLNNMISVRSSDPAIRLRKSSSYIDLLTIVDQEQLEIFFRDDIDRIQIRGLVDLKEIENALSKVNDFKTFVEVLNKHNANIFSNFKLNQMNKSFDKKVVTNAIQELYEYDLKLKKTLTTLSRTANTRYVERGVWLLYASYGFLSGFTTSSRTSIKAPLVNIPIDFEIHGTKMYIVKKDKSLVINEMLYVFLLREYNNNIALNELSNSTNLKEIITDIERITGQPVHHSLDDTSQPKFVKYKEEAFGNLDDTKVGLSVFGSTTASIIELTGGKLKQDLSRILDLGEDPFALAPTEKSTDYFENEIVKGSTNLLQIHRPINVYQKYAISSSLNQNTVIIGAPGTGKSEVIANLMANVIYNKKNGILVSEKKAALDVVVNRVGKLNSLILYMHDFESKEGFYSHIINMEEKLGQWYRDDIEDFLDGNKIEDKIKEFFVFYSHFCNLINCEIELSSKRDHYNENYIDYTNGKFVGTEINNQVRISSYLLLPDQTTNSSLWMSMSDYLSRSMATNAAVELRKWYNVNHYLFDEENFEDFIKNIWNEYVYFKKICNEHKELIEAFPKLVKALLHSDTVSARDDVYKWSTWTSSKLIKLLHAILENGLATNGKKIKIPLLGLKNSLDKSTYRQHIVQFREFLGQFSRVKHLNWITYNKLDEFELSNSEWKHIIQENWWFNLFESNPLIKILRDHPFQQQINEFKRAEEFFTKDNDEFIFINYIKWLKHELKRMNTSDRKMFMDMFKQASKSVRPPVTLFIKTYYQQLRKIFPIWVLNPDNVAQYIPLQKHIFDYGIFDEASQMFLERGYPLVYRCKFNTVAGDMNQLKPTSFFMARNDEGADAERSTEEILEGDELNFDENESIVSLLEKAENVRWNKFHLRNHYRSVSKQLIEFSNKNIYNNNLRVASINGIWNEKTLEVIDVNGIWHNRVNEVEAKRVIKLIKENHKSYNSILVVAFNLQQAAAIEDMLMNDESVDTKIKERINKSIFVTNLENVQGSEADLVLLSVSFGYSEDNILRANFGAINRDGGRNRLNVAITRARQKMIVIKSFKASDFNNRSLSGDAMIFINWIRYLDDLKAIESTDMLVFRKSAHREFDNSFIETVYNEINKLNLGDDYYLSTKLPIGDKVIDIGIMDSRTNRCLLGIVADRWSSNMSVKSKIEDCDYQIFLESRNYKMFRIKEYEWSTLKNTIMQTIRNKFIEIHTNN